MSWLNKYWQRKQKYSEKTCPSVILSSTKPTWGELVSKPEHRNGKPAGATEVYSVLIVSSDICLALQRAYLHFVWISNIIDAFYKSRSCHPSCFDDPYKCSLNYYCKWIINIWMIQLCRFSCGTYKLQLRMIREIYCHVSGVPWPIIAGSGLDD
jgi:hypothetical protein